MWALWRGSLGHTVPHQKLPVECCLLLKVNCKDFIQCHLCDDGKIQRHLDQRFIECETTTIFEVTVQYQKLPVECCLLLKVNCKDFIQCHLCDDGKTQRHLDHRIIECETTTVFEVTYDHSQKHLETL